MKLEAQTVGELRRVLADYSDDMQLIVVNDNYAFGGIHNVCVDLSNWGNVVSIDVSHMTP